jgi:DNA ligase-1
MAKKTTSLPSRELLQLAEEWKEQSISGYFFSEKLDGVRMWWDGGATRGVPIEQIPFANVLKQDRFLQQQLSTGLWSRYGHPIFAPDSWINNLPNFMLDGEVWLGRHLHQQTQSIVRTLPANRIDSNWDSMKYKIFDTPPLTKVMQIGEINNLNFRMVITPDIASWFNTQFVEKKCRPISIRGFESQYKFLQMYLPNNSVVSLHEQIKLNNSEIAAQKELRDRFNELVQLGAEGAVVRAPHDEWSPVRSKYMIKFKQVNDAEATVVGYTSAEYGETGAKLGLLGALHLSYMGKSFKIGTGFTDAERDFGNAEATCEVTLW